MKQLLFYANFPWNYQTCLQINTEISFNLSNDFILFQTYFFTDANDSVYNKKSSKNHFDIL